MANLNNRRRPRSACGVTALMLLSSLLLGSAPGAYAQLGESAQVDSLIQESIPAPTQESTLSPDFTQEDTPTSIQDGEDDTDIDIITGDEDGTDGSQQEVSAQEKDPAKTAQDIIDRNKKAIDELNRLKNQKNQGFIDGLNDKMPAKPNPRGQVKLTPSGGSGEAGTEITVEVKGFKPGTPVKITFDGKEVKTDPNPCTIGNDGTASCKFKLGNKLQLRPYEVKIQGGTGKDAMFASGFYTVRP